MQRKSAYAVLCVCVLGGVEACASDPGTRSRDQSAVAHERTAQEEEHKALLEEKLADPEAESRVVDQSWPDCDRSTRACLEARARISESRSRAEEHRALAEKHRAAAEKLRQEESEKCSGVGEAEREANPFARMDGVRAVNALGDGAEVVFVDTPGMTSERLQRLVDCYLARATVEGSAWDDQGSPLDVQGARAQVRASEEGLVVRLTARNPESAGQILQRARALENESWVTR